MAGITDSLENITSLIDKVSGSITDALAFQNITLNIFGCELKPNTAVSDKYCFKNGGKSQPQSQLPSNKAIENAAAKPTNAKQSGEVPYAEPTKAQADVSLR